MELTRGTKNILDVATLYDEPFMKVEQPSSRVSSIYSFVPTKFAVDQIVSRGWNPVSYESPKRRSDEQASYGRHTITFEHKDGIIFNGLKPRVHLDNSYNGLSPLRINGGMQRLICTNGMMISVGKSVAIRAVHKGLDKGWIDDILEKAIESAKYGITRAEEWSTQILEEEEKLTFANILLNSPKISTRFYNKAPDSWTEDDMEALMSPVRDEDTGNDLFTFMNVLQEKILRGGFMLEKDSGKIRKVKPLNDVFRSGYINKEIWEATEEFAN